MIKPKSDIILNLFLSLKNVLIYNTSCKFLLIIFLCLGLSSAVYSSTITTTGSGNWSSTTPDAPWPGGTVPASNDSIIIANGNTVTLTNSQICKGLTINNGGILNIGGFAFTVNSNTNVIGTLNISSATATKTFNGDITISSGGVWNETAGAAVNCSGNFTNNAATFTASSGVHTFSGTNKTFSGSTNTSIANITITGSYTNNGILTATATLTGTGGSLTNGTNASLHIDMPSFDISTLTASASGNTVDYGYTGGTAQVIRDITYHHLTLSGNSPKTVAGISPVNGNLSHGGGSSVTLNNGFSIGGYLNISPASSINLANGTAITVSGNVAGGGTITIGTTGRTINIGGNWAFTGTVSTTGLNMNFNGTGTQTCTGSNNSMNVTVNKSSGEVQLLGAKTIGTLLMTAGTFNPNGFLATINTALTFNGGTLMVPTATWGGSYSVTTTPAAGTTINYSNAAATILNTITYQNLTYSGSGTAGISGNISIEGDLSNTGGGSLNFGNNVTIGGTVTNTNIAGFTTSGSVTMAKTAGTATFTGNVQGATLTINGVGGTLHLGSGLTHTFTGSWTRTNGTLNGGSSTLKTGANISGTGGTFIAGSGTIEWNRSGNQTIAGLTYYNLVLSGSGSRTLSAGTTVGNNCTLSGSVSTSTITGFGVGGNLVIGDGTSFTASNVALTVTGTTTVGGGTSGTLTISSATGAKTFTGDVVINAGATWNNSGNSPVSMGGSITNSGTFTAGSGQYTLSGGTKTINGTITLPSISISGSYTNNGTLTVTTALAGAGSLTNGATGSLHIDFTGTPAITTLTANTTGNTVDYGFAGTQTVKAVTYYNLTLSGSGAKTFGSAATINNDLSFIGTASANLGTLTTHSANHLYFAGIAQYSGTWGSTSSTTATHKTNTYFAATTGFITISTCPGAVWSGTTDNDWGKSSNWCGGSVPTASTDVTIQPGSNPVAIGSSAVCRNLTIVSGASLSITGSNTLTVSGDWSNNGGTFTPNSGTVIFNGSVQNITGTNTFNNVTIGGNGIKTISTSTFTVNGILSMEGTGTLSSVPTYGAAATLQYNTATPRTTGVEWISPFLATGGIIIDNTGRITMSVPTQFGNSTNVPLNIKAGANLSTNNLGLTFYGDFVNKGILGAGSSVITFTGTNAQNIDSFTTSGSIIITKTAGSVTLKGNINAADLSFTTATSDCNVSLNTSVSLKLNGPLTMGRPVNTSNTGTIFAVNSGTLYCSNIVLSGTSALRSTTISLSSGTITASGDITSAGTSCFLTFTGAGKLNVAGTFMSGNAGTFTASTGTVNFNGAGQTIAPFAYTFNNVTLSGSGVKTLTNATINGILSMEGTATATGTVTAYGSAATLQYKGTGAQSTGTEFPATWNGTGGVIIANTSGNAVTLNEAKQFGTNTNVPLRIDNGAILSTSASNFGLTFHGDFLNNGSLSAGSSAVTITGTTAKQNISGFSTTGTVTMSKTAGTATFRGNVNGSNLTLSGSGGTLNLGQGYTHTFTGIWTRTAGTMNGSTSTLKINGSVSGTGGTFNADTSTIEWNAAGPQTIAGLAYHHLTLSGSGAKTLSTGTSVAGNFTLNGTSSTTTVAALTIGGNLSLGDGTNITNAGYDLTVSGTTTISNGSSGGFTISSATGTKIFTGLLTLGSGRTWNNSGNSPVTFTGGITNNGTFTAGSGLHTFSTNNQALSGNFSIPNISVSGITLTNNDSLTVSTALSGSGGLTQAAGARLNIGGSAGITTLSAVNAGNTVNYSGSNQTVNSTTYANLILSGSGSITTTGVNVSGLLSMDGSTTANGSISYSGSGIKTLRYNGSATQTTSENEFPATNGPAHLIINNPNVVKFNLDRTLAGNLTINNGSLFEISPAASLKVNGTTANNAADTGLKIKSDASGTGNLIHYTSGVHAKVERYISGSPANKPTHFVSSPILGGTLGSIMKSTDYNVYYYDETNTSSNLSNSWVRIIGVASALENGRGYSIISQDTQRTNIFKGALAIPADLTDSGINVTFTSSGTAANDGWNLIGNPFPCALDAPAFLSDNSGILYSTSLYYWDDHNGVRNGSQDYAIRGILGGTAAYLGSSPNDKISVGQGFFVKVTATSKIKMLTTHRATNNSSQFFIPDPLQVQKLWISATNPNEQYNETMLGFLTEGTTGVDHLYDALKIKGNPDFALYSIIDGSSDPYAIQALPLIDKKTEVKLGLLAAKPGWYTFKLKAMENFDPQMVVLLKDLQNGEVTNLRKDSSYRVPLNPGEYKSRFVLKFFPDGIVDEDTTTEVIGIYTYGNTIYISGKANIAYPATISDITGRIVKTVDLKQVPVNEINTSGLSGIYFVSVVSYHGNVTRKIFCNNNR
jgi:hypothetical protein